MIKHYTDLQLHLVSYETHCIQTSVSSPQSISCWGFNRARWHKDDCKKSNSLQCTLASSYHTQVYISASSKNVFTYATLASVLWHCWLGGRNGIRPVKKWGDGGGGHWLVRMEWRPAGWSVCLPLLIFPCTIKSRSSLLALAHPGGPGKRAVNWLWCGGDAS